MIELIWNSMKIALDDPTAIRRKKLKAVLSLDKYKLLLSQEYSKLEYLNTFKMFPKRMREILTES